MSISFQPEFHHFLISSAFQYPVSMNNITSTNAVKAPSTKDVTQVALRLDKVLAFVPAFGTSYGKQRNQGVVQAFAPDDPYVKNVFLPLMPTSFECRLR